LRLVVGTRGSKLSLIQTEEVLAKLRRRFPEVDFGVKVIKTMGDRFSTKPLLEIKAKGIFEKEIDTALVAGQVDFAVHSMKDVPVAQDLPVRIVAVPERGSPRDVLVSRGKVRLKELPPGSVVGTSSPRRAALVKWARPDLEVMAIRGNVETRIARMERAGLDAIVLAEVGLLRLGMEHLIAEGLRIDQFAPAPGQGALAVVTADRDARVNEMLGEISHQPSMAEAMAERALLRALGGGCKMPVGALGRAGPDGLTLTGSVITPDGRRRIDASLRGTPDGAEELGEAVAKELIERGAAALIGE